MEAKCLEYGVSSMEYRGRVGTASRHSCFINFRWRVTATAVGNSGVSRSAFSRRKPGASSLGPSSPQVLRTSSYVPSQPSGLPMLPPLSAVSNLCTFAQELRSALHFCTASLVLGPSGPRVLESPCYATIPFTTFAGSTPVSLKSSPWWRYVKRSWSIPMRCRMVACRSCTCTGSLATL
ncbi:MAG: hypothetical protein RL079_1022 [Verrucomicrobiota bacterium]